ncbi:hypothetical protein STENM327S_01466 [Streptomyces tendae]
MTGGTGRKIPNTPLSDVGNRCQEVRSTLHRGSRSKKATASSRHRGRQSAATWRARSAYCRMSARIRSSTPARSPIARISATVSGAQAGSPKAFSTKARSGPLTADSRRTTVYVCRPSRMSVPVGFPIASASPNRSR